MVAARLVAVFLSHVQLRSIDLLGLFCTWFSPLLQVFISTYNMSSSASLLMPTSSLERRCSEAADGFDCVTPRAYVLEQLKPSPVSGVRCHAALQDSITAQPGWVARIC